jgi:hypothetical protein
MANYTSTLDVSTRNKLFVECRVCKLFASIVTTNQIIKEQTISNWNFHDSTFLVNQGKVIEKVFTFGMWLCRKKGVLGIVPFGGVKYTKCAQNVE